MEFASFGSPTRIIGKMLAVTGTRQGVVIQLWNNPSIDVEMTDAPNSWIVLKLFWIISWIWIFLIGILSLGVESYDYSICKETC